jgi:hypothetical protein
LDGEAKVPGQRQLAKHSRRGLGDGHYALANNLLTLSLIVLMAGGLAWSRDCCTYGRCPDSRTLIYGCVSPREPRAEGSSRYSALWVNSSKYAAGTCLLLAAQATSFLCFERGSVYATVSTSRARSTAQTAFSTV